MKKHLTKKSIIGTITLAALLTPMFALALPCTRTVSSPSALKDVSALFNRFR